MLALRLHAFVMQFGIQKNAGDAKTSRIEMFVCCRSNIIPQFHL